MSDNNFCTKCGRDIRKCSCQTWKDERIEELSTLCKDMAGALEKTYETIKSLDGYDSNFFRASDFEAVQDAINLLKQALEKFKEVMK